MSKLAEKMLARRELWCELPELGDGRRVKLRRPPEAQILAMQGGVALADVQAAAVGWEGVTEADLIGTEQGASDLVPFEAAAWAELAADSVLIAGRCAAALNEAITAHIKKVADTQGN